MNCGQVQNGDIIERYLSAKLTGAERKQLESHYFECDECFVQLESARAASQVLRETGPVAIRTRPRWVRPALAIAAALVMAVAVRQARRQGPPPQDAAWKTTPAATSSGPPLLLAEIQAPPYSPVVLRGGGDGAAQAFQDAMAGYSRSDWGGTKAALGHVIEKFPHSAEALYFRAICQLLSGDTAASLEGLNRTIERGSATPFEEEARYYRAQAYLLEDRRAEARAELDRVIAMHGDYAAKAQALEKKF
jgi:hypothetical protein